MGADFYMNPPDGGDRGTINRLRDKIAILKAERDSRWLPIDTAPKDGTAIIGLSEEGVIECSWEVDNYRQIGGWLPITLDWHGQGGGRGVVREFTHWMPLPPDPRKTLDDEPTTPDEEEA